MLNNLNLNLNHKADERYTISEGEMYLIIGYTITACIYLFCVMLLYRQVFVTRPAIEKAKKRVYLLVPEKQTEPMKPMECMEREEK